MNFKMNNTSFSVRIRPVFFVVFVAMLLCLSYADKHYNNMFEPCDEGKCCAGQRFDSVSGTCVPCESGTYIDIFNHSCLDCRPCTVPEPSDNEMVVSNCTPVSDTAVGCLHGHHRVKEDALSSTCQPCSKCENGTEVVRRCEGGNNTICSLKTTVTSSFGGGNHGQINTTVLSTAESKLLKRSSHTLIFVVITVTVIIFVVATTLLFIKIRLKNRIHSAMKGSYRKNYNKLNEGQEISL